MNQVVTKFFTDEDIREHYRTTQWAKGMLREAAVAVRAQLNNLAYDTRYISHSAVANVRTSEQVALFRLVQLDDDNSIYLFIGMESHAAFYGVRTNSIFLAPEECTYPLTDRQIMMAYDTDTIHQMAYKLYRLLDSDISPEALPGEYR
jgi:hypothetical protein